MMKAVARFADYSITGGVWWLSLALFLTILHMEPSSDGESLQLSDALYLWESWMMDYSAPMAALPSELTPAVSALGVVLIFFTGMLLDLINPWYLNALEMHYFRKHTLRRHEQWLKPFMEKNITFVGESFDDFLSGKLSDREQINNYDQIRAFLINYTLVFANEARLDELLDRIRLWRMARSLATSMFLLAILFSLFGWLYSSAWQLALAILMPIILLTASLLITRSAFRNLCLNLIAFIYYTEQRRSETDT